MNKEIDEARTDITVKALRPQTFRYEKPPTHRQGVKEVVIMCQTPTMRGSVHVLRQGSGESLHSHSTVDGFWMVLTGRVRFYGDGDVYYGEFGPMEGIMMPRHNRYWFESVGEGDSEILQVLHFELHKGFEREEHDEPKFKKEDVRLFYGGTRFDKQN